ncbi:MAG: C10 family peptidase [Bacteroidales bacterium]
MKKFLLFAVFILSGLLVQAKFVSQDKAKEMAIAYSGQFSALRSDNISLAYAATSALRSAGAYYYVFNMGNNGFVVVSGDDRAYPVLGHSLKGTFDIDNLPPNFRWLLDCYQSEIEHLSDTIPALPEWNLAASAAEASAAQVYLETAEWGQSAPYNALCPMDGSTRSLTGCVATAMAILLKYHSDNTSVPVRGSGSHSYVWTSPATSARQTLSVTFGDYDWNNMPMKTTDFINETQRTAISRLMYHCGVAVDAQYGGSSTAAYLSDNLLSLIGTSSGETALKDWFGFTDDCEHIYQESFSLNGWPWVSSYTETQYGAFLKTELNNNRPVIMGGSQTGSDDIGHCWICSGYDDSNQFYFNWGWDGKDNGWYRLFASGASPNPYSAGLEILTNTYREGITIEPQEEEQEPEPEPVLHDTVWVNNYIYIHDTTYIPVEVTREIHDTVVKGVEVVNYVHDTIYLAATAIHDTVRIETTNEVHDTVIKEVDKYIYVSVMDTVRVPVPVEVIREIHDTVQIETVREVEVIKTETVYVVIDRATGIQYPVVSELQVVAFGSALLIQGLKANKTFDIYTVKGEKYFSATAGLLGEYLLLDIPKGIYILYQDGEYSKFSY